MDFIGVSSMQLQVLLALTIIPMLITGCASREEQAMKQLQTVPFVDLNRYVGQWYEIARYPNRFQKGCVGSRATYTLRDDGKINVVNACYEGAPSGPLRSAKGKAWVVDTETNAKLKVSFFWPFSGDYWIIDLGQEYEYAVVGHPKRTYLWILSRTPEMSEEVYESILMRLQNQQYDTAQLIRTGQTIKNLSP